MKRRSWRIAGALLTALIAGGLIAACGGDDDGDDVPDEVTSPTPGGSPIDIQLTSPSLEEGAEFPAELTCDGGDTSPELIWTGVPQSTQTLTLIMEDVDKNFFHWVVVNLERDRNGLAAGAGNETPVPTATTSGAPTVSQLVQGVNTFGERGYGGPCPPSNDEHVYRFRLYALDAALQVGEGSTAADALDAMKGHVIAWGELSGTYRR